MDLRDTRIWLGMALCLFGHGFAGSDLRHLVRREFGSPEATRRDMWFDSDPSRHATNLWSKKYSSCSDVFV
jgi:hypothetical protein